MSAFLFQIDLVADASIVAVIPQHRLAVNRLMEKGIISSYSVAANRSMLWCVLFADNEQKAMDIVAALPLQPFFLDVVCHPLMFTNSAPAEFPGIVLN
jgi:hypothetical protein